MERLGFAQSIYISCALVDILSAGHVVAYRLILIKRSPAIVAPREKVAGGDGEVLFGQERHCDGCL